MDEDIARYYEQINKAQQANNAWSAEQAEKAMQYQTEMSNTAHQREVADLKAAGLNPVLSAGGSGATTGSGIAAQAGNENVSALYGLIKQSIDAQAKQAEALKNAAKSIGRGSGSGIGSDESERSPWLNSLADFVYRRTGIKQEHFLEAVDQVAGFVGDNEEMLANGLEDILFNWNYFKQNLASFAGIPNTGDKLKYDLESLKYTLLDYIEARQYNNVSAKGSSFKKKKNIYNKGAGKSSFMEQKQYVN